MPPRTKVPLEEAGRVLSAANETTLRNAIKAMQSMLDDMVGGGSKSGTVKEAVEILHLLESDLSSDQKSTAIRAAILSGMPAYPPCYVYVRALYDDYVIYAKSGDGEGSDLFRAEYTFAADGTVTLGTPVEVEAQLSYVPVTDADGLNEAAMGPDHGAMTGEHTHPHPAMGASGGDATHSHAHSHDANAAHDHAHADLPASQDKTPMASESAALQEVELVEFAPLVGAR